MNHAIWAIVPAAGIGKRMQSNIPKQYLSLNGRPVLEHTVNALLQNEHITGLIIALQQDDAYWPDIKIRSQKPVLRTEGGKERADSVLNALTALVKCEQFGDADWVMVHDAVRPCLTQDDIDKLASEVDDENGGLLALPVRDTMKRQNKNNTVAQTIDRDKLWHALTPQYFPALRLKKALQDAQMNKLTITDESSAMELAGYSPKLVQGQEDNIKITRPDDLRLASLYLQAQSRANRD
ncbi:MAG: 2-C-methyl-D-erythritol 4-phosphate cytidylyltransferase [Gammaproteobacteria bacterium]|nr:2-C-methyl-D-erythritol 4-phosphate cytidylyltransferase [Gammaproteobacteria bacterium]